MMEHSAAALVVAEGQKPWLNIDGKECPLGNEVFDSELATGMLAEIAPDESRSAIQSGLGASFVYSCAGDSVQVEISPGPKGVLKPVAAGTVDPAAAAQTDDPEKAPPADHAERAAPAVDPKKAAPADHSDKAARNGDPEEAAPTDNPKKAAPPDNPEAAAATVDPEKAAPAVDPKKAAPTDDSKKAAPTDDPKKAAPAVDPKKAAPAGGPKKAAPIDHPEVAAATDHPEKAAATDHPEKAEEKGVRSSIRGSSSRPLMEQLFYNLVELGGSDLHLTTGVPPMVRIDGDLKELEGYDVLDAETTLRVLLEITPERNAKEFEETGDTDFAYEIEGLGRFRCNLFRDLKGPGGVSRIIPTDILTASDLGLSPAVRQLATLTKGLVLVTGPTGSGKSTTLAALIDLVNSDRHDHILTIEDPIEFVHPNKKCLVNQREVHLHTSGFNRALRAALREDPDVILIGELRDLETIAMAIETAETGHLVFGTLHTTSAVSTVDRMIDQFPADQQAQIRVMLSASLRGVVAQVLCKKIGGGRVAALEVLIVNSAVSNLIREGKTFQIPSIMQTGKKLGMVELNDALFDLVADGIVEPHEAYLKTTEKGALASRFQVEQIPTDFLE